MPWPTWKVEEERRHWTTRRRAEAIYSIHGRANTNLRLDVQTAPGSLPLFLSPFYSLHLFPAFLPTSPPFLHPIIPPSTTSSSRSASYSSSRRNTSRQLVISHQATCTHLHPTPSLTTCIRVYIEGTNTCPGWTGPGLWTLTSSRFDRR